MDKREEFLRIADEMGEDVGGEPDEWTGEPWPEWFKNVALRLARVFIPKLKRADFVNHRERFEGYGAAFVSGIVKEAEKISLTELPETLHPIKDALVEIRTVQSERVRATLRAASDLSVEQGREFFEGYVDGSKRKITEYAMARLADNQTVQICFFLIFARPWIEKKQVANVTSLFRGFIQLVEAFPKKKEFFKKNPAARRSLEQHFRRICSADGVRLAKRGHPRTNRTSKRRAR